MQCLSAAAAAAFTVLEENVVIGMPHLQIADQPIESQGCVSVRECISESNRAF